jgi:hypothetical protein
MQSSILVCLLRCRVCGEGRSSPEEEEYVSKVNIAASQLGGLSAWVVLLEAPGDEKETV